MRNRKLSVALVGSVLLALAAIGTVAVAARSNHKSLRAAFHVLHLRSAHAADANDPLPAAVAQALSGADGAGGGIGVQTAGATYVSNGAFDGWVVPGKSGVCLAIKAGPAIHDACFSTTRAEAGRAAVTTIRAAGQRTIFGLAPDGNATVRATGQDGGVVTVPVVDNVYAVTVAGTPQSVQLKDASGNAVEMTGFAGTPSSSAP